MRGRIAKKAQARAVAHANKKGVTRDLVPGRGRHAGQMVRKTGSAFSWTTEASDQLCVAVAENTFPPDKRSPTGIRWAAIKRRAPTDYPLLVERRADKALSKHWKDICAAV